MILRVGSSNLSTPAILILEWLMQLMIMPEVKATKLDELSFKRLKEAVNKASKPTSDLVELMGRSKKDGE